MGHLPTPVEPVAKNPIFHSQVAAAKPAPPRRVAAVGKCLELGAAAPSWPSGRRESMDLQSRQVPSGKLT